MSEYFIDPNYDDREVLCNANSIGLIGDNVFDIPDPVITLIEDIYRNSARINNYDVIYDHMLFHYTSFNFAPINTYLRSRENDNKQKVSGVIYTLLHCITELVDDSAPTEREYTAYRGYNAYYPSLKVGSYVSDKGFSSISLLESVSRGFVSKGTLFVIKVPVGTKMFYVSQRENNMNDLTRCNKSKYDCQYEILTYPGVRLRVDKIERRVIRNKIDVVHVTLDIGRYKFGSSNKEVMKTYEIDGSIDRRFSRLMSYSKQFKSSIFAYYHNVRGKKKKYTATEGKAANRDYKRDRNEDIMPSELMISNLYFNIIFGDNPVEMFYLTNVYDDRTSEREGNYPELSLQYNPSDARTFFSTHFRGFYKSRTSSVKMDDINDIVLPARPMNFSYTQKKITLSDIEDDLTFRELDGPEMILLNEVYEFLANKNLFQYETVVSQTGQTLFIKAQRLPSFMLSEDIFTDEQVLTTKINEYNINNLYVLPNGRIAGFLHILCGGYMKIPNDEHQLQFIFNYLLGIRGVDIAIRDSENNTPLHIAVSKGFLLAVKIILSKIESPIHVEAKGPFGRTPIINNILADDYEENIHNRNAIFDAFLQFSDDIPYLSVDGRGYYHFEWIIMVMSQKTSAIPSLSRFLPKLLERSPDDEMVINLFKTKYIAMLLDLWHGVYQDIDKSEYSGDKDTISPSIVRVIDILGLKENMEGLMIHDDITNEVSELADKLGNAELTRFLAFFARNEENEDRMEIVELDVPKVDGFPVPLALSSLGNAQLYVNKANINTQLIGRSKQPILHYFISSRKLKLGAAEREETFEYLVNIEGVDINLEDNEGKTPLHKSIIRPRVKETEILLDMKEVRLNVQDKYKNTPLYYNVLKFNVRKHKVRTKIFDLFIEKNLIEKLDINIKNENNRTLLQGMVMSMANRDNIPYISKYMVEFIRTFNKEIEKDHWWDMLNSLFNIWISTDSQGIDEVIENVVNYGGGVDNIDVEAIPDITINDVEYMSSIRYNVYMLTLIIQIKSKKESIEEGGPEDLRDILKKRTKPEDLQEVNPSLSSFKDFLEPFKKKQRISSPIGNYLTNDVCDHCGTDLPDSYVKINGITFIVCSQMCSDSIYDNVNSIQNTYQ